VPFARGRCRDVSALGARRPDGTPVPIQCRALDRWGDGSVRWALVDLYLDVSSAVDPTSPLVEVSPDLPVAIPLERIWTSEHPTSVRVETGDATLVFKQGEAEALTIQRAPDRPPVPLRLTLRDAAGVAHSPAIDAIDVEERGTLRTVVRMYGHVTSGDTWLDVTCRVHAFCGLSAIRCDVTLRNPHRAQHENGQWDLGDPGSVLVQRWSLSLGDEAGSSQGVVRVSLDPERPADLMKAPFTVHQASSGGEHWESRNHVTRSGRVTLAFRGYRGSAGTEAFEGRRADPIVISGTGGGQLALFVESFWQNFPTAIRTIGGAISADLFAASAEAPEELQGGEQKTHTVWLQVGEDPLTDLPLAWAREPVLAHPAPEDYAASGAVPYLTSGEIASSAGHAALVSSVIDGPDSFDWKREIIDEFGWRHFGEIYGDHEAVRHNGPSRLVSHYNNQYDPVAGFAQQFMRTGQADWWRHMRELAAHVVDIDIYHTDQDKAAYNRGLFWHTIHYTDAETATHRTYPASCGHGGGPSSEHNYSTGLMLAWFLTGDARYREAALDLAHFPIRIDDGLRTPFRWLAHGDTGLASASETLAYQGPGRGAGNSVSALVDGYRLTGNRLFLDKAEQIIQRVVHPDDDVDRHDLGDAERRWFYTMFLQALGKYLDEKIDRNELDWMYGYAQASLLRYARWMVDHEYPYLEKPERLMFPTESWAAQDIRKCDVFNFARKHAADPVERARFAERASFFYANSVATLSNSPTRTLARPVVVLLTSGWTQPWFEQHPEAAAPRGAAVDEGMHVSFEPQRIRAMRRIRGMAGTAAVVTVLGLVWVLGLLPRIGFL
jgi:hypothetical protein